MKNPFCISKAELRSMWEDKQKDRLFGLIKKFKEKFTVQEMLSQMESDEGEFGKAVKESTHNFTNKTENVEIMLASELSDLYFPGKDTEICFDMKSKFSKENLVYDGLVSNIESATHVDCCVKYDRKQFNFQIKRYPQPFLKYTNEVLDNYLEETISSYGDMQGTILIILLQPNGEKSDISFVEAHKFLLSIKEKISFDEIDIVFNEMNQRLRWIQVFPQHGVSEKPLNFLSEKFKKIQNELNQ